MYKVRWEMYKNVETYLLQVGHSRREGGFPLGHVSLWHLTVLIVWRHWISSLLELTEGKCLRVMQTDWRNRMWLCHLYLYTGSDWDSWLGSCFLGRTHEYNLHAACEPCFSVPGVTPRQWSGSLSCNPKSIWLRQLTRITRQPSHTRLNFGVPFFWTPNHAMDLVERS